MLDPVAQLTKHGVRYVHRILSDEVDTNSLGSDEPHDLFNLFQKGFWSFVEEKVRFVKEEDKFGLFGIPGLRELFEELREKPQQECGVEDVNGA